MNDKAITIYPTNGLGNRLRTIFYYRYIAKQQNKKLLVIWQSNKWCNGKFSELFLPIPDVTIIDMDEKMGDPFMFNKKAFDYKGFGPTGWWDVAKKFSPDELVPSSNVRSRVEDNIKNIGKNYISLHIRKTDGVEEQNTIAEKYGYRTTEDSEWHEFVNSCNLPFYLATDCRNVQQEFIDLYKDRMPVIKIIPTTTNLRQTSLLDAVIDIYTCIGSQNFLGTKHSSFSMLIDVLGKFGTYINPSKIQSKDKYTHGRNQ